MVKCEVPSFHVVSCHLMSYMLGAMCWQNFSRDCVDNLRCNEEYSAGTKAAKVEA